MFVGTDWLSSPSGNFSYLVLLSCKLGFNCGEAANFATPQWLRFAREAAVRRAAMNYLPMLSHQQLLYLLTMSFVSRSAHIHVPDAPIYICVYALLEY